MTGQNSRQRKAVVMSVNDIARILGGEVAGDGNLTIRGINSLEEAGPGEISFLTNPRFRDRIVNTSASALIIREQTPLYNGPQVLVADPKIAYVKVAGLFAPDIPPFAEGNDRAFRYESCSIGKDVSIYPSVYIGEEAVIGDGSILFPGVFIGNRVRIGKRTVIYPNVSILEDCRVGNDVIIHGGTVIGSDGFGFVQDGIQSIKIPQLGIVQIDDRVEIGANNCIDRAAFGKTWIKSGVKTDNLVQIAHNVTIGENTIIVAQAGISGSVKVGRQVVIGGQVGVADHLEIGDRVMIASQSGIAKSVCPGEIVSGTPAMPHRRWLRVSNLLARLPEMIHTVRDLEKRLNILEMEQHKE